MTHGLGAPLARAIEPVADQRAGLLKSTKAGAGPARLGVARPSMKRGPARAANPLQAPRDAGETGDGLCPKGGSRNDGAPHTGRATRPNGCTICLPDII